jgi:hypothetical protein
MTAATRSFKPIADYLHANGLRFGLHLMRGIPRQAVDRDNSPILGTAYKAADIANKRSTCPWNTDMYGVDMSKPGAQEYYDSVFALLASWDLDYVKVDDLSAPYHKDEIEAIRKAIDRSGRPIVLSTSPGATPVSEGEHIQMHANLWRISDDFWDDWRALYAQFARLNRWSPFRGPGHWPDADMLPLGNVRTWQTTGDWTHFTKDEQFTLLTLWCIVRSPLIVGGNMPRNDEFTLALLTNDEVLAVNQNSANNRQLFSTNHTVAWVADVPASKDKYVPTSRASSIPRSILKGASAPASSRPRPRACMLDIGGVKYPLTKGDDGAWVGDSKPQDEGFHYYQIVVDGAQVPDPNSLYFYGASRWGSGVEVPAQDQDFYALKNVPHGQLREVLYFSKSSQLPIATASFTPRRIMTRTRPSAIRCCICNTAWAKMKPAGAARGMPT